MSKESGETPPQSGSLVDLPRDLPFHERVRQMREQSGSMDAMSIEAFVTLLRDFYGEGSVIRVRHASPESTCEKFSRLAKQWQEQSAPMSSSTAMVLIPAYQHIIGMGWDAVPLMLRELRDDPDPDHWFSALEAITEADPVPEEQWGNIKAMAAAWVEWGEREGCI